MLGNYVEVHLIGPVETINGELRKHDAEGVWVYFGWGEKAAVHFYPHHRIRDMIDRGRVTRW